MDGVVARLSVEPSEVERDDSTTVRVSLTNTSPNTTTWTSGWGCLGFLNFYRGEEHVPFVGTTWACTAVITTWEIAPGDSLVRQWRIPMKTTDGSPVDLGEYRVVMELSTRTGPLELTHSLVVAKER